MNHRVLSVTFEINAHHGGGRFSIPVDVCEILGGLNNGDLVYLTVENLNGEVLYSGEKALASGREIYGPELKVRIDAGQRIRVTASRTQ